MSSDRSEIEDCFEFIKTKQDQGYDLIFFPNPGNSGDAVIACATIQQLEKRRIRCTLARSGMQHKPSNYYIYSGGGNLVPFYADAAKVLASLSRQKAGLCVLPHSCFGVDSVLQLYEGDHTIFAREATTQHYLRSLDARHLTIKIDHDIGLSLDMEDPRLAMPRTFNALYGNAGRGQSLCILRNDCESVANPLLAGKNSIDISNLWPKSLLKNPASTARMGQLPQV